MRTLPVHFNLSGRTVLLVGTGPAADAKARLIAAAGGTVRQVAETGQLEQADLPEDLAPIAFVAIEATDVATHWRATLRQRGLVVNVVDTPALCDFSVPAVVDRGSVVLSIATGGASASLSKALRERLEVWLPAGLGRLADAIADARASVAQVHSSVISRRAFWDRLLAPGGALDPMAIDDAAAEKLHATIASALRETGAGKTAGMVTLTLAGPHRDDVTLGQLRMLQQADLVVADHDVPDSVLALARRDAACMTAEDYDRDPQAVQGQSSDSRVVRVRLSAG